MDCGELARIAPLLLLLLGCTATTPQALPNDDQEPKKIPGPTTKYVVGDYVTYRYAGSHLKAPVVLHERILTVDGNRLAIEVEAKRGEQKRHWIQKVTDTPENQRNNVVDELIEVTPSGKVILENKNNADVFRLYSWILPPSFTGTPTPSPKSSAIRMLAGKEYDCRLDVGHAPTAQGNVTYEFAHCPEFVWTNGPSSIKDANGNTLWEMSVEAAGRTP